MKRFVSFFLTVIIVLTLLLPVNVSAATMSSTAGAVNIASGSLNVRSSGSTSAPVVTSLSKHSFVTLISQSGKWWKVEYAKDRYGYCHADYITELSSKAHKVNISSGSLNVRSGPSTAYAKNGSLAKGETVVVLSSSGEWRRILYHGTKIGYVNGKYLSTNVSSGNSAVSLSVPSFKQTDPRWANVTLGSSGKTIGKIGCVTTSIAMLESYRTGRTIYPDAMSKKLSYSSTGNVYWPSDYKAVTSSQGYLSGIYALLKEGKPVLFGAKNAYSGQHWVVITGYNGNGSFSAADFTINDPGSDSRTTLQHLLNTYPYFYKYLHY